MTKPDAVEDDKLTPRGMLKLAEWLVYCESIGWPDESMSALEKIWRQYRDKDGRLRSE